MGREGGKVKMAPSETLIESYWIALSISICVCYLEILRFLLSVMGKNRAFLLIGMTPDNEYDIFLKTAVFLLLGSGKSAA